MVNGVSNHIRTNDIYGGRQAELLTTPLTAEALILYCQSKLRGLDDQVHRAFGDQQARARTNKKLGELSVTLGEFSNGIGASDQPAKKKVLDAYDAAIKAAGADSPLGRDLAAQRTKFSDTTTGVAKNNNGKEDAPDIDPGEIQELSDALTSMQATVNKDGELEMLQLQSVMSQRQQALQLCTNLVQSINQTAMSVVQNVGK